MGSLTKAAFLISLGILWVPADPAELQRTTGGREPTFFGTLGFAQTAYSDARGFCGRNPEACITGVALLGTFEAKARTGARMLYGWVGPTDASKPVAPLADSIATGSLGTTPGPAPSASVPLPKRKPEAGEPAQTRADAAALPVPRAKNT